MSEKLDDTVRKKRGKKYCVAYGCNNIADETSRTAGISFHTFPISDHERCKKWEHAMHRQNFQASKWSIVCSTHFEPECFDRTGQKVRIRENAVPTIFNVPVHLQMEKKERKPPKVRTAAATVECPSMPTPQSPVSTSVVVELDGHSGMSPEDNSTIQPTSSGVSCIDTEHNYGVLESPLKLKRRLNSMNEALESYHKRLKMSQQRSRRLAKRVKSMETVIRDLKEKSLLSEQAAENLSASFSGGALELIKRP